MNEQIMYEQWKIAQQLWAIPMKANAKHVLQNLCWRYNSRDDRMPFPSINMIAKDCGLSRATVQRSIKHLKEDEWLVVNRRYNDSNIYQLNLKKIMQYQPDTPSVNMTSPVSEREGYQSDATQYQSDATPVSQRGTNNEYNNEYNNELDEGAGSPSTTNLLVQQRSLTPQTIATVDNQAATRQPNSLVSLRSQSPQTIDSIENQAVATRLHSDESVGTRLDIHGREIIKCSKCDQRAYRKGYCERHYRLYQQDQGGHHAQSTQLL